MLKIYQFRLLFLFYISAVKKKKTKKESINPEVNDLYEEGAVYYNLLNIFLLYLGPILTYLQDLLFNFSL